MQLCFYPVSRHGSGLPVASRDLSALGHPALRSPRNGGVADTKARFFLMVFDDDSHELGI